VARLWSHGATLYDGAWVDRPQGLVLVFRALHLVDGSPVAMRVAAAVVAALVVAATMVLTLRLARGRITAAVAGLLAATVGASPFVESFTLSGELLASLPAVVSLLCFSLYLRNRQARWLVTAGLLTGLGVLVKQSAFDAGLAAVVYLLWRERRRGLAPAGLLVSAALLPVVIAAASAARLNEWLYAVVGYRFHGDSLVTGSLAGRAHQLWLSLPPAAKGLGVLVLLAGIGWRRSPLLARFWLVAAAIGVLGGGNFHPHYYLQLVPPLSLLGAVGLRTLWHGRRRRPALTAAFAGAAATIALALPVAFASPAAQARAIWPHDPHLEHDGALAGYVRTHTRARDRVLAVWADASLYYLADRRPAIRYLWARNVASVPGALAAVHRVLAARRAALVLVVQPLAKLDPSGRTARLLRREYRRVGRVRGVSVYRSRIHRKTSATSSPSTAT
jgi:4-amino-4-deoxy-L-arabinose transferase-like glycosyltransferase